MSRCPVTWRCVRRSGPPMAWTTCRPSRRWPPSRRTGGPTAAWRPATCSPPPTNPPRNHRPPRARHSAALILPLFHADAEPVLQLVQRREPSVVEGLIPQAPERLPRRLVTAAEQACRPLHCLCPLLLAHRHLLFRGSRPQVFSLAQFATPLTAPGIAYTHTGPAAARRAGPNGP